MRKSICSQAKLVQRICAIFFFIISTWCTQSLFAQSVATDSLLQILEQKAPNDTARIRLTLRIADQLFFAHAQQTLGLLNALDPLMARAEKSQSIDRLHYYGAAHQRLGNMDSVEHYHQQILSMITKEEDDRAYARALANLGVAYRAKGKLDDAARMYEEALAIFETKPDTFPKGTIRNSLGLIYDAKGDYRRSMKYYLEALDIFKLVKHDGAIAIVLNNIGQVYHTQKDYDKAIEYYKKYLTHSRNKNIKRGEATSMNNIGEVFMHLGQLDSAEFYLQESLLIKEAIQLKSEMATALNNLGEIANLRANYSLAIDYNQRGLLMARNQENKRDESYCLIGLGNSYAHLQQYARAQTDYQQALLLAKEMGDQKLMYNAYFGLYRSYKPTNREQAFRYLENAFELKDSLLNAENVEALTTLRLENAFQQKELINQQKITTLELQEQLNEAQLSNQRWIISGLLIALLVFAWLWYQLLKQRNQIKQQNAIIQQALKEKDTLLREIHHRVKNNLQVISSLLGIQSRHVKDQVAVDALNEGRNRVQTMSLIHQDLYQKDNLTGIAIRPYFTKLLNNVLNTYQIDQEEIRVHSDIDDLILDVDTVIPLGLILNELISNAMKYAFPHGKGEIVVSLKEVPEGLHLRVRDNGVGMVSTVLQHGDSYGYELIRALVDKLEGELEVKNEEGTSVSALLKAYQKAA